MKDKKGFEIEMIGWWVLGLAVLVIVLLGYLMLSGKLASASSFISDLFRFRS